MMEFWARSPQHRVKDEDRFFVKQGLFGCAYLRQKKLSTPKVSPTSDCTGKNRWATI